MKTETPRTDAAITDLRTEIVRLAPDIKPDKMNLIEVYMLLVASSAIIDHLNEQSQRK